MFPFGVDGFMWAVAPSGTSFWSGAGVASIFSEFNSMSGLFLLAGNQLYDWFTHRQGRCGGGGGKKSIALFTHKQRHLSIDMKTKIVQHGPRINISI